VIGIFKQKNPINFFLLLLFGLLIKLPIFNTYYIPDVKDYDGVLYKSLVNFLNPLNQQFHALYPALSFIILFIQAMMLNSFMNKQRMRKSQNFLPCLCYLVIPTLFTVCNQLSDTMFINAFLLLILSVLFKTYNQPEAKGPVFNCGFILGVASFLFFPVIVFVLWIFLAMMVIRPFRLNEWLLFLLGLTTPVYFYGGWLYLTDKWDTAALIPQITFGLPQLQQNLFLAGGLTLLVIPFLTGAWYVQDNLRKMLINIRKAWSLFFINMTNSFFVPFL